MVVVKHLDAASAKTIVKNSKNNFLDFMNKVKNDKLGAFELIDEALDRDI